MNEININLSVIKELLSDRLKKYKQSEADTLYFVNMWQEAYHDEYYVYEERYIIMAIKVDNPIYGDSEFAILEKDYLKKIAEYRDERIEEIFK